MKLFSTFAFALLTLFSGTGHAVDLQPYSEAAVMQAQQQGKPHAIHFHADWCPTCRAQEKVFQSLKGDKEVDLPIYVADYDKERELKRKLNIRSQSTLVVYRGAEEKARMAGDTDAGKIRALLKKAY